MTNNISHFFEFHYYSSRFGLDLRDLLSSPSATYKYNKPTGLILMAVSWDRECPKCWTWCRAWVCRLPNPTSVLCPRLWICSAHWKEFIFNNHIEIFVAYLQIHSRFKVYFCLPLLYRQRQSQLVYYPWQIL